MSTITQSRPVRVSINNRSRRCLQLPLMPFTLKHPVPVTRIVTTITGPDPTTPPPPTPSPALPIRDRSPAIGTPQQQRAQPPPVRSLLDQALPPPLPLLHDRLRLRVRVPAGRSNARGARRVGIGPLRRSGGTCPDLRPRPQAQAQTQTQTRQQHESDNSLLASRP